MSMHEEIAAAVARSIALPPVASSAAVSTASRDDVAHRAVHFERFTLHTEVLLLLTALFIVALANLPFWHALLANHSLADWRSWRFGLGIFTALTAFHYVFLGLLAPRPAIRIVLSAIVVLSMLSSYYMRRFGIVIDPDMMRNVLHTDWHEARELINTDMLLYMLFAVLPIGTIWLVRLRTRAFRRAVIARTLTLVLALIVGSAALLVSFKEFSSTMREQRGIRYMLTPGNVLWSLGKVFADDHLKVARVQEAVDPAARLLPASAARKPVLLVMVVGETARAANFGLNGYARMNTPELVARNVINFPDTTACGTSTEVSVPCMFSPFGRRHYDEERIRNHESLLHLADRAGVQVSWLDNQSGCKGVCRGLDFVDLGQVQNRPGDPAETRGLCDDGHCQDEILLRALQQRMATGDPAQDRFIVLHQLGNHGPAYFRRYPQRFEIYAPECKDDDLGKCSGEQIVNAYDNAIAYTDHLLGGIIDYLAGLEDRYDVAMIYVSDHGESLGEHGLFLHGVPYAIAPAEQTHVPMVWWLPPQSARNLDVDTACLRDQAAAPVSHDNLFPSILGLLRIDTPRYVRDNDLLAGCRTRRTDVALAASTAK